MNNTHKRGLIIFATVSVLWVAVIFSFSLRSGTVSHHESGFVEHLLSAAAHRLNISVDHRLFSIFTPFVERPPVTSEAFIRKSAHLTEYFILGLICVQAFWLLKRRRHRFAPLPLLLGPVVSIFDERIIQLFLVSGRTSSYRDVTLDSIGFYSAVLLSIAAVRLFARLRKNRQPNETL